MARKPNTCQEQKELSQASFGNKKKSSFTAKVLRSSVSYIFCTEKSSRRGKLCFSSQWTRESAKRSMYPESRVLWLPTWQLNPAVHPSGRPSCKETSSTFKSLFTPQDAHSKWQVQSIGLEKQLLCRFSSMLLQNSCNFKNRVKKKIKKKIISHRLTHKISLLKLTVADLKPWSATTFTPQSKKSSVLSKNSADYVQASSISSVFLALFFPPSCNIEQDHVRHQREKKVLL